MRTSFKKVMVYKDKIEKYNLKFALKKNIYNNVRCLNSLHNIFDRVRYQFLREKNICINFTNNKFTKFNIVIQSFLCFCVNGTSVFHWNTQKLYHTIVNSATVFGRVSQKNCEILLADCLFGGVCVKFYFTMSVLPVISAG
jgi:hypothetical protein